MAIQMGDTLRNNRANQTESTAGTSAILEIRSGSPPATCATADSGTLLASMTLPVDWLTAASGGAVSQSGTWEDLLANNAGTAGHFRLKNSAGSVCHMQGTVTATGGGGDMTVDNTSIALNQVVRVTSFTLTEGGA
jgi:hypothetical protein